MTYHDEVAQLLADLDAVAAAITDEHIEQRYQELLAKMGVPDPGADPGMPEDGGVTAR